jgi:hypothetical protein
MIEMDRAHRAVLVIVLVSIWMFWIFSRNESISSIVIDFELRYNPKNRQAEPIQDNNIIIPIASNICSF